MLDIHGNACEGGSIDVYDPFVHRSVKSLMIFKSLTRMTTDNIHSYMVGMFPYAIL